MSRKSIDQYYLEMLALVASRSTCPRRAVAAIIVDRRGQVLSTGYNGVPSGYPHCLEQPCPGTRDQPGDSSNCMAIHAEQNALLQCKDLDRADVIYCSTMPCFTCSKLIANTPIKHVFYLEPYPDERGAGLLAYLGRILHHVNVAEDEA